MIYWKIASVLDLFGTFEFMRQVAMSDSWTNIFKASVDPGHKTDLIDLFMNETDSFLLIDSVNNLLNIAY